MIYFLYDGSFEGLLTAIYEAYYRDEKPDHIVALGELEPDLFSYPITITTDQEKSEKVYRAIEDKISYLTLQHVFYVHLSDLQERGTLVYNYLKLGWRVGTNLNHYLAEECVRRVLEISQKVSRERHRLLGLIRFERLERDLYYAAIEPDHNIVGLVAPHFVKRLSDQNWMIHDLRRKLVAVYNKKEWMLTSLDVPQRLIYDDKESYYQSLWKNYFTSTAIQGRINPRLQKQFMPVRYWKHLVEKKPLNT